MKLRALFATLFLLCPAASAQHPNATVATVPTWSASDDGYNFTMVGQSPYTALANQTTTIVTPIIPVVLTFSDGTVFDPTKTSSCASTAPSSLLLSSPIFSSTAFAAGGTGVGTTTYHDFFQRANFWQYTGPTGVNPNYHLLFSASVGTPVNITVPAASGSTVTESCGKMGEVEFNFLNNYLLTTGFAQLASNGVLPSQIPVFLMGNVVMYNSVVTSCCTLGFHSSFNNVNYSGALQLFAVADFDTTGVFGVTTDVSPLSHELAELINDPTGNNPTPPWGGVGQVTSGCQANLEVGDPLVGSEIEVTMPNNYTYHLQELAFLNWFYRQSPSGSVNGWYSSNGTFKTYSAVCNPTTTTLSITPASFNQGAIATIAVTVAPTTTQTAVPTGTVTLVSGSGSTLETYTLSAGAVSASTTTLPAGSYTVTAKYSGDANFSPSSSAAVTIAVGAPAVTFSPVSLSFASTVIGASSSAQSVKLTNTGTAPLTGIAVSLAGASPGDYSQTSTCGASLAVNAACTVSVTFKPAAAGSRTASISVADNAPASPQTVPLSGTGLTPTPAVSLSASALAFGSVKVSVASAAQKITLTNTGTAALSITSVALAGINSADFAETNTCTGSVAVNGTCAVTVIFTASAMGARSATLTLTDNASGSTQSVALTGTGITPVTLSAASLAFGSVATGSASAAQTLTLTNSGTAPAAVASIAVSGANAADFAETTTCGTTLAAAGTCTITVTFTPAATGSRSASLTFTAGGTAQSVSLSGTGAVPVTVSVSSLAFGSVKVSASAAAQAITVTNIGTIAAPLTAPVVSGTNAADFSETTTCGSSLAANSACTITVTFTPSALGARSATVAVTDSASASTLSVALTGTGVTPVTLSAASLAFGSVAVGAASAGQTLTLTNSGAAAAAVASIAVSGTNAADFAETTTCGTTIAAGGTCAISVTLTPSAAGTRSASLTFTAGGTAQSVPLTGTGTVPVTVSVSTLSFGSVKVGSSAAAQVITLTNTSSKVAAALTAPSVSGANAADFSETTTCGASLAAGASCTITVTFLPVAPGTISASLTFTAGGTAESVSLSGTATATSRSGATVSGSSPAALKI